ncbi:MAG TPA: alpha amylase family protein [Bacteroidales bacterium]|nr:alpha amylase family protein [Bacteroidales bacterium]
MKRFKTKTLKSKKNLLYLLIYLLFLPSLVMSCEKEDGKVLPPEKQDTTNTSNSDTAITNLFDKTPVLLWIEAAANFERLGTAEKMNAVFQKVAAMGVKGIVVDIKGIPGLVSYNSSIAKRLKSWDGYTQADDFDYLQNAITQAKRNGLKVFASMSVFAEGFSYGGVQLGKAYTDENFKKLQSQVMTANGAVKNITDVYSYGLMNPLQPAVQDYELSLIKEVVANYAIDGFVLDYCRYFNITADFSDYSLQKFKEWANLSSVSPTDIVKTWTTSSGGSVVPSETGPYYKQWLEFRAQTIYNFVEKARSSVKTIKTHLPFCSYSGAWYDSYYEMGVNWASKKYDPSANGFSSWATPSYKNTGYAELIDMFMTGNYTSTLYGNGWWTVQGQISGANTVLQNANIHYGAIDIGNTQWSNLQNMKDAIVMILQRTKGIMLFDLVHIDGAQYNQFNKQLYDDVKTAIKTGLAK